MLNSSEEYYQTMPDDEADAADAGNDVPGPRAMLMTPATTIAFMLAGNAYVTFQSKKTGTRFTYRVVASQKREGTIGGPTHFVSVLNGSDNNGDYAYLGCIFKRHTYAQTRGSRISREAPSAIAFGWVWDHLIEGEMHPQLDVWHEGRCGKCGRRLTDPSSIASGLGPTCRGRGAP